MDIHMHQELTVLKPLKKIHELGITTPIIALTASVKYNWKIDISIIKWVIF
jgi:hypothetical protein